MIAPGTLYIVATPIGNLGDLSDRARMILGQVDLIAAEDTRHTRKLLSAMSVSTRLVSYYEGANEASSRKNILAALLEGKDVALVSDAGSPGINDPGFRVIRDVVAQGIALAVVPGPSAMVAALELSALPTDRFAFYGFLPRKGKDRTSAMEHMAAFGGTIVLYESPRRIAATLLDLAAFFPTAAAALCRELTKLHETVDRGTVRELAERYADRQVKGEITLVIHLEEPDRDASAFAVRKARQIRDKLGLPAKQAAYAASVFTGVSKNTIYRALLSDKEG